jgi:signal transduction histidine kinase
MSNWPAPHGREPPRPAERIMKMHGQPEQKTPIGVPGDLLEATSAAVLTAWPDDSVTTIDALREELEAIAEWVRTYRGTGEKTDLTDRGDLLLQRRLIEALRLGVLGVWSEAHHEADPADVLGVLEALEELSRVSLPKDARDFASRLADPDGFELLVEVAHDLRSPLTSISFLAETLRGGHSGEINEVQRTQLGLIYSAAMGMSTVVSDVMELARRGGDLADESPAGFSIAALFEDVRRLVQPMAEEKRIDLRFELPEHERVKGHAAAIHRVLLNLVTNALKYTEEGWVTVSARHVDRETVEFLVRDTGRGIDEESQKTLFQPFRKASDRKGSFFSGSGLGLSIARRLVNAIGSELEYQTKEGWGTTFRFRVELPAVRHY